MVLKSSKNVLFFGGEFGVAVHEVGPCTRWDRLLVGSIVVLESPLSIVSLEHLLGILNTTYLIIDALDECVADLPKLLDFVVRKSAGSPCVKWIVSSRNWPNIEERLERAGHKVGLCLELNAESVSTVVSIFIQHKVLRVAEQKKYNDKTRAAVLHHLSLNANNTFLWVALVCQNLENISRWNTVAKLSAFPPGLDSLYKRMLEQIRNSDSANLCERIPASIAILYRPITLKELTSLVDMFEDVSDDLESVGEIIRLCGSFLTVREGTIYFVH